MNNPTGDTPWEEEPGAETVRHVDGDMVGRILNFTGLSSKALSTRIQIFLKTEVFSPFLKKFASTRSAFESFSSVHT